MISGYGPLRAAHRRVVDEGVGREDVVELVPTPEVDRVAVRDQQVLDLQAVGDLLEAAHGQSMADPPRSPGAPPGREPAWWVRSSPVCKSRVRQAERERPEED